MNKDFWERLDTLVKRAQSATPYTVSTIAFIKDCEGHWALELPTRDDMEFVAAANPAMILEMAEALKALTKKVSDQKAHIGRQAERIKVLEEDKERLREAYRKEKRRLVVEFRSPEGSDAETAKEFEALKKIAHLQTEIRGREKGHGGKMNQELQVKIDRIKELAEKYKEIKSVDVDGVEVINMKNHVDSKEITEYLNLVMPPTVLELIDEFHKIEMHEHYMEQWADYDMEQAHKTVDWVCELQRILGFEEIGETKNTRAEITAKVKELVAESKRVERLEKEADWLSMSLAKRGNTEIFCCPENEPYKPIIECVAEHGSCANCWREAARNAVSK